MKNITVLQILVITVFSFLAVYPLYGIDQNVTSNFSLGVSHGFIYGQSFEIVYPYSTPYKYLSELIWDMKPVYYFGLQADYTGLIAAGNLGFFTSLSFYTGLPSVSGIMEDRDWMNIFNTSLTHYSRHTNKTREFFWLDIEAGITIPFKNIFDLKPLLNISWMRFAFTGRDGYGKYNYPGWPSNVSYEGKEVIRYEQNWFILAAGLCAGTDAVSPYYFALSFLISPLIYCTAKDVHLPSTVYNDYMSFGLFLEPKASVLISANNIDFALEFSYRRIRGTKGISVITDGKNQYTASNNSGSGLSILNVCFFIKFGI